MKFSIGSKIRFIHTGDAGIVIGWLGDGMLNIRLLDDEESEIPAFEDDIVKESDYKTPPPAPTLKNKANSATPENLPIQTFSQYKILKSLGLQVAFEPILRSDGSTHKFLTYIINDFPFDVIYSFLLVLDNKNIIENNGKIQSQSVLNVGEMPFEALHQALEIDMEAWKITTEGRSETLTKIIKVKPKAFFNNMITAPFLNKRVHHYIVFDNFENEIKQEDDLKTYTKKNTTPKPIFSPENHAKKLSKNEVHEFANFNTEIDLHIENLVPSHSSMSNAEIIKTQLWHFERFLDKAIRLGVNRVFVIHGVGKGKLRDEIATRLLQYREVETFKNEFHPKYGWGATEVILS